MSQYKRYIACHYTEKDQAKALGARWDPKVKLWYANSFKTYNKLNRWHIKTTKPELVIYNKSEPITKAPPNPTPPKTYIDLKDVSDDKTYYVWVPGHGYIDEDLADMYSIPDYD